MPLVTLLAALTTGSDLLITSTDRQAILERLYQRQAIRREIGVRPIHITEVYHRKVQRMTENRFDALMEPYIDAMFSQINWPDSFTGRLLLAVKKYRECSTQCEIDTGHTNPRTRPPDMLKFIERYADPLT